MDTKITDFTSNCVELQDLCVYGIQAGNMTKADELLNNNRPDFIGIRYLISEKQGRDIVAIIRNQGSWVVEVDNNYQSILTNQTITYMKQKGRSKGRIYGVSNPAFRYIEPDHFNKYNDLFNLEIDGLETELYGIHDSSYEVPKTHNTRKKLFVLLN